MAKILSFILSGRKGVALILTVGILALLSMLGATFALVTIMEQKGTWNYVNAAKARFLAEAGISRAIAELKFGSQGAVANAVDTQAETWCTLGYSDSTFFSEQGRYSVSIIDCASQINLNDQNTNARISQILQNLNTLLGSPLTVAECTAIVANRPYATKEQIKLHLSGQIDNKYDAIKQYITVYGYVDPDVVDPTDLIVPVYGSQPRSPINVNTASQVVIRAVLTGLQGVHICPNCGGDGYLRAAWGGNPSCTECGGSGTLSIDSTEAQALAQYIVSNRPYSTWSQFYASVKACASIGPRDADLVMANANPNTGFSWARNAGWATRMGYVGKCVFDYNKNHVFDASDFGLTQSTTEFSFNSGGYYEITSTGSYKGSQKVMKAVVKLFDIFRQTTQAQFNTGDTSTVRTYPENTDAGVSAAIYDGQVMLPRVTRATPDSGTYFRATYYTSVDGAAGGGNLILFDTANKPNVASVANFTDGNSRGDLQPDGLLIDYFGPDYGYYRPVGNISADAGTMEIWFKPKYNSKDCMLYGDSDQDRKMFRLTSGVAVGGGFPYETFLFWSDSGFLWGALLGGGGYYNDVTSQWSFVQLPLQWNYQAAGVTWNTGQWNQLVLSWKNPVEWWKSSSYNSISNPVSLYINGTKKATANRYHYHTSYADSTTDYALEAGFERDSHNSNQFELSNAVIGSVRIWDYMLGDNGVQAEYDSGMYQKTGSYTYTSAAFDPGQNLLWGTITWTEAIPNGINGEVVLDVDTGSGSFSGNWNDPGSGRPINTRGDSIIYRAALSTSVGSGTPLLDTPVLEDVTITYLPKTQILYVQ